MTEPINASYERVQQEAKGPGVEEWKRTDKLRADLTATYQSLKDDPRYTEKHKAETAWAKYEETRSQVERLAPEARKKMLRSAKGLERMSIPTPEGEGLITKDANKLLLTAHERSRLEGLIARWEKTAKGPFKANPMDILKAAYEQGLEQGGPGGGATVRAVYELARDWGLDINTVVDQHRKPHHHGALEDAQTARMRADMVGRTVSKPPFPHPEKRTWSKVVEAPVLVDCFDWTNDRRIFSVLVWPPLEVDPPEAYALHEERVEEVISAISRGASEKAWCTRWEIDDSLRWDHKRRAWEASDGFAYESPSEGGGVSYGAM